MGFKLESRTPIHKAVRVLQDRFIRGHVPASVGSRFDAEANGHALIVEMRDPPGDYEIPDRFMGYKVRVRMVD